MDGKREVNALMDRDFEAFPPRNWMESLQKNFRTIVIDPMVRLKGEYYDFPRLLHFSNYSFTVINILVVIISLIFSCNLEFLIFYSLY